MIKFFYDSGYTLLEVPLREMNNNKDVATFDLRDKGYLKYVGDTQRNFIPYRKFELEKKTEMFVRSGKIGKNGYDTYVYLIFYQLTKIKILDCQFNPKKDTAYVKLGIFYNVTPLEDIPANPKILTCSLVKKDNFWKILDLYKLTEKIYDNMPTGNGGYLRRIFPETILKSLDSLYKVSKPDIK